jgi:hypothetical protein
VAGGIRSTDVDASIGDADRERPPSTVRTHVRRYQGRPVNLEWTPADDADRDEVVLLQGLPDAHERASVTMESGGNESGMADDVERGLKMPKAFAERRHRAARARHHRSHRHHLPGRAASNVGPDRRLRRTRGGR